MIQLLWLRNDLRLNDNEGFRLAIESKAPLSVIYILPKHWLQEDSKNMTRLGAAKASFLRAALIDLHRQLEDQTIHFHIYCGDVEAVFSRIFEELFEEHFNKEANQSVRLLTSHPQAPEERDTLESIQTLMTRFPFDSQIDTYDSQTLFSSSQCQTLLDDFPSTFTAFRKHVEGNPIEWQVAADIKTPPLRLHEQSLRFNAPISWPHRHTCSALSLSGGERSGKEWLTEYLWKQEAIAHYKRSRNDLTDDPKVCASSSHLSAYLA